VTTPTPLPHTTHHDDCGCLSARYEARIAALEAELAEAREHAEAWESEADSANTLGQSWMAHANAMRDALEEVLPGLSFSQQSRFRSLLDDSPAASLAAHDAEVVERCAELEHYQWMEWAQNVMDTEQGLSADRRERWSSLMVPYAELSEEMKDHDRKWARLALAAQEQGVYAYCAVCGKPVARGECDGNPPHSHSRCALAAQEVTK